MNDGLSKSLKKNGNIGLQGKPPPLVDLIHQNVLFKFP